MNNPNQFLLIDDDDTNNILCTYTIGGTFKGAEIRAFTDPEKGLATIKEMAVEKDSLPTALFLDINMPDMTGWELLEEFNKLENGVKARFVIYIMSSSLDMRDREKAELHPLVSGYISKPLTPELLTSIFADDIAESRSIPNKWYGLA